MGDAYASAETDSIRYVLADPSSEALDQDSSLELLFFRFAVQRLIDFLMRLTSNAAWRRPCLLDPSGVLAVFRDVT